MRIREPESVGNSYNSNRYSHLKIEMVTVSLCRTNWWDFYFQKKKIKRSSRCGK